MQSMAAKNGPTSTLDALASSGLSGTIAGGPGARGVAILEHFRRGTQADPYSVTRTVRANASRAMEAPTGAVTGATMVDFVTRWMPWGRAGKGTIFLSFGMAHACDRMALGEWEHAEALLHLLLCGVEQSIYDDGRWSMAWLVTQLPEPPWHMMHMQAPTDGIWPYGRLTPPEWVAGSMQFITDAAKLAEVRKRGQRRGPDAEGEEDGPEGKGKGRGGRRGRP